MRRQLCAAGVLALLAGAAVSAADFWETKAFTTWSPMEAQKVLTDSPWSQKISATIAARGAGRGDDAAPRGGGGRGGGRGAGGARGGAAAPQLQMMLSWRSALPMKQALVRSQTAAGGAVSADQQEMLDRKEDMYVITLLGVPAQLSAAAENVKEVTTLVREGKSPVAPSEVLDAPQPDGTVIMIFTFPRSAAIDLADKDVEFVSKLGAAEVKKKFSLKDMVFHGKLEL